MQRVLHRVDPNLVRRLASWRGEPVVTSLYLDVDGRERPVAADCQRAFEQLADDARRRARSWPFAEAVPSVEADLDAMRTWIARGIDRSATRGVALFSCHDQGRFEAVELPMPVPDRVAIGPSPRIRELVEAHDPEPILLALIDRTHLRLFRVFGHGIEELPSTAAHHERAVDDSVELGSFERRHEEAAHAHVRRSVADLEAAPREWSAVRIVVGGPDEPLAELERRLAPSTRTMVVGRVGVGLAAPLDEIAGAARAVGERADRDRTAALLGDLAQRAAGAHGTAIGLDATLTALAQQRVGVLFVKDGYWAPGVRCTSCDYVGLDRPRCPVCDTPIEIVDDVVEAAIERAVLQGADVEFCRGPELDLFGRIAAIERY
ncbi:MAG: hypothetical protein RLZZ362_987 [Actinomycetota bacterium]